MENITYELAIAGIAVPYLYYFMRQEYPDDIEPEFDQKFMSKDKNLSKRVMKYGLSSRNKLCKRGTDMMQRVLGYEVGNCAAKMLCFGGIYIIGGVVQNNIESLNKDLIVSSIFAKPPHIRRLLSQVPIYIVRDGSIGLLGSKYMVKQLLKA